MDIENFTAISRSVKDPLRLFDILNDMAKIIIGKVEGTRGTVVKFIGDACIIVFPDDAVDEGVRTLLDIKGSVEGFFRGLGFSNKLSVGAHFGEAAMGEYGCGSHVRIDVFGESVNIAAMVDRGGHKGRFVISPQAFRTLSPPDAEALP